MKKINKKGFILVEAIVVGVFVLSLFTFLFVNIIPLIGKYEEQEMYDTIDGIYNTNLIRAMILGDDNMNAVLTLGDTPYVLYTPATFCAKLNKVNYCNKLLSKDYLNVKKIYITWYRTNSIKNVAKNANNDFDRATRDYIANIDNFSQPTGAIYEKYKRIIIYYDDGSFTNMELEVKGGDV